MIGELSSVHSKRDEGIRNLGENPIDKPTTNAMVAKVSALSGKVDVGWRNKAVMSWMVFEQ